MLEAVHQALAIQTKTPETEMRSRVVAQETLTIIINGSVVVPITAVVERESPGSGSGTVSLNKFRYSHLCTNW